jgi:predicted DNA-binding transcriptional regulator YafY
VLLQILSIQTRSLNGFIKTLHGLVFFRSTSFYTKERFIIAIQNSCTTVQLICTVKFIFGILLKCRKMPVNRNALVRYRAIDKCLQNRRRKWTIKDLITACSQALYEYEGVDNPVSMRTMRMDLQAMRSEQLGYNAPIIVTDKKFYSYEDPHYSITQIPLSSQDLNMLQEVSQLLRQFKGFTHFNEVNEMVHKLEDKIYSEKLHRAPIIDFEKNELLRGIEWLDPLYKSIVSQTTIQITYQSFKARSGSEFVLYPYLLKEYRNRWFVLGMKKKGKEIITLALDRIQSFETMPDELFLEQKHFNPHTYFNDIVGVTRNIGESACLINFWASSLHAPYIKTKPLHGSQTIVDEGKSGTFFSIRVIPNFELEREFLGFGNGIKILSPANFLRRIKKRVSLMYEMYGSGIKEERKS